MAEISGTCPGSFVSTIRSRLKEVPFVEGQLIFVRDEKAIYRDETTGIRNRFTDLIIIRTDEQRLAIEAPLEKFYFVQETSVLWLYTTEWNQLSNPVENPVYMAHERTEFPTIGFATTLYICDEGIFRWNGEDNIYTAVANDWHTIQHISCGTSSEIINTQAV